MKQKLIVGAKYFIRDKVLNEIRDIQVNSVDKDILKYKNLSSNEEFVRAIGDVEIYTITTYEELKSLNNSDFFSVQTKSIKGILSRDEIILHSQNNFKDFNIDKDTVLISITDPNREYLKSNIQEKFKEVLNIQFWDIEENNGKQQVISLDNAKIIKNFIIKNKNNNFMIHCEVGISRSSSVGLFILFVCEYNCDSTNFDLNNNEIINHRRYSPNYFVYHTIFNQFKKLDTNVI